MISERTREIPIDTNVTVHVEDVRLITSMRACTFGLPSLVCTGARKIRFYEAGILAQAIFHTNFSITATKYNFPQKLLG